LHSGRIEYASTISQRKQVLWGDLGLAVFLVKLEKLFLRLGFNDLFQPILTVISQLQGGFVEVKLAARKLEILMRQYLAAENIVAGFLRCMLR
jgi:hypothetical protein